MSAGIQHGYLVLADISGFTSFLAASELEHAQDVLAELLELVVGRLTPLLTLVEIEGDAVYTYAPDSAFPSGEVLLELLEATYVTFRDRVEAIRRHTTCDCNACRLIPSLDLKFVVHHGEYYMQSVAGSQKPVGSAVNLLHRLTKSHVTEDTGWRGYILFSEAARERLGLDPASLHVQVESYEHLGETRTYSMDLLPRYREIVDARRVFVRPEDADALIAVDVPASPLVVWEWLNDPEKRLSWEGTVIRAEKHDGRRGLGARNHCLHGKNAVTIQTIVDWRPFDYFTYEAQDAGAPKPDLMITHRLDSSDTGTRLTVTAQLLMSLPRILRRAVVAYVVKRYKIRKHYERLTRLLAGASDHQDIGDTGIGEARGGTVTRAQN